MSDLQYVKSIAEGLEHLDGLVLNHGTMGACLRIGQMDVEDWESIFRVNVSSCVALVSFPVDVQRAACCTTLGRRSS